MTPDDHISLLSDRNLDAGRGEAVALVADDGATTTYAQLHRAICRFAARLADRGVRRGERVVLVMDDTPRFHAAFLGSVRAGAVPVPVNFLAREEDFGYFMADSYAVLAVVDEVFLAKVGPQAQALGVPVLVGGREGPETGVALDEPARTGASPSRTGVRGVSRAREADTVEAWLADGPDHVDPLTTHPDDPGFWLYSSGSTGKPKGVVHAQRDIAATCRSYADGVLGLTPQDRTFSTTKLFHAYGFGNGMSFPMWVGATAILMTGRPEPDRALDKVVEHRPTVLFSVPALYNAMSGLPDVTAMDLSSLRLGVSAAEALPAEVWRNWHELTGTEILDGIGSTEMLHIFCSNRAGRVVPGSSGEPVPGYELQLRDEDGQVLEGPGPDGGDVAGDLYVAGESALTQYWHRRDKTEATKFGRWVFSGDRYRRDADGIYFYEGRADDMIKVKGLWVSPIEIENRLIEHEAVNEAAVIGVDRDGMTRVKAHVILNDGHEGSDDLVGALQDWCRAALLRYQYPHEVEFLSDFPRTATGKVQRFKLRAADAS